MDPEEELLRENLKIMQTVQEEVENLQKLLGSLGAEFEKLKAPPAKLHIFVFGSNESGVHGAGAAAYAVAHHGAIYGQGFGLQGNSYAIPTKDYHIETLPIHKIVVYVDRFLLDAQMNPEVIFDVTRIGCGLAGYTDADIAPLFVKASENCYFPSEWLSILGSEFNYHNLH